MTKGLVKLECMMCHRIYDVNSDMVEIYDSPAIRENATCPFCMGKAKKIKIALKCCKCGGEFQTKVFVQNKNEYDGKWICPKCTSNEAPKPGQPGKAPAELACTECRVKRGVCGYPELACALSKAFVQFDNSNLYTIKKGKGCTILSVHGIDNSRNDIHCLAYTPLFKSKYLISARNVVIIKQRMGSRKNFMTNVIVYQYDGQTRQFKTAYDKKFGKGDNWIPHIKAFLLDKVAVHKGCEPATSR